MIKEKLQLNKKFLVVESPIPFEIFCPEQNDGVKRRQGSWQMTIHDLLTTSHYPLNPIYNLELIYDETLLNENEKVSWYTTDLNLGEALRGIDGQLVTFGDIVLDTKVTNFPEQINTNKVFAISNNRFLRQYIYSDGLGVSISDFLKDIVSLGSTKIILDELNFSLISRFSSSGSSYTNHYSVNDNLVLLQKEIDTNLSTLSDYIGSVLNIKKDSNETITNVQLLVYHLPKNSLVVSTYGINLLNADNDVRFLKFKFCY
jgi:hypothetical protein